MPGSSEHSEGTDINPEISFNFEKSSLFQEGVILKSYQWPDKSSFQETQELESLVNSKSKRLGMINKDRAFSKYNSRDLVYIISLLMRQLHTASRKVIIKYVGPVVIYKIIDPHNYLLMTLDGKILRGLFQHKRLKPVNIRTNQGNVQNFAQLKQVVNVGL